MVIDYQEKLWSEHQLISSEELNRIERGVSDAVAQVNRNTETVQSNKETISALEGRVATAEGAQETAAEAQRQVATMSATMAAYDAQAKQLLENTQQATIAAEAAQKVGEDAKAAAEALTEASTKASKDAEEAKLAAEEVKNLAEQTKTAAEKTAEDAAAALKEVRSIENTAEESAQKAAASETNAAKSASDAQEAINTVTTLKAEVETSASTAGTAAINAETSAQNAKASENAAKEAADQVSQDAISVDKAKQDVAAKVLEADELVTEVKNVSAAFDLKSSEFNDSYNTAKEEITAQTDQLKKDLATSLAAVETSADSAKEGIASAGKTQLDAIDLALKNFDDDVKTAKEAVSSKVSEASDSASSAATSAQEAAASAELSEENKSKLEKLLETVAEDKKAIEEYQKKIDEQFEQLKAAFEKQPACSRDPMVDILADRLAAAENQLLASKIEAGTKIDISTQATTTNNSADVVIEGASLTDVTRTVNAKNIIIPGMNLTNSKLTLKAIEDVTITGLATNGEFPKKSGNCPLTINADGSVVIKNSSLNQSSYNGIEVGLGTGMTPSEVIIEGVHADVVNNNFINVFDLAEGATLVIRNCSVMKCSNFLRLSSKNDHNYNVILDNCSMAECDSGVWHGWICLEDYTSTKAGKDPLEVKQFGKMNITMINCLLNGQKITETDMAKICGTQDENQVLVLCNDPSADVVPYDPELYPTLKIEYR